MKPTVRAALVTMICLTASVPPAVDASTISGYCMPGAVPAPVMTSDRIYLRTGGSCTESDIMVFLERVNGPAGTHLVQTDVVRHGVWRDRHPHYASEPSTVFVVDPIGSLAVGGEYRLTIRHRRPSKRGRLLVNPSDWTIIPKFTFPDGRCLADEAYTLFVVEPDRRGEWPTPEPEITGHTIRREDELKGQVSLNLCVSSANIQPDRFSSYLWVIEMLTSDGKWHWKYAWRPKKAQKDDPRCAFVIRWHYMFESLMARDGKFVFRPTIIASNGTRWIGPEREVPLDTVLNLTPRSSGPKSAPCAASGR